MSFSNAACQTCRKRHLKCDEGLPECQRCIKSRRACYRAGAIIHIENFFASRKQKRPRGPRSRPSDEPLFNHSVLVQTPSIDIHTVARTYYLHQHLRSVGYTPGMLKSQSDDVLRLWPNAQESGLLDLSLSCIALAVFSQTHRHPQAAIQASEKYQGLLQVAQTNMSSITPENIDICLLATFFMARYEDSMYGLDTSRPHRTFAAALKSVPHHEGALAMLESWQSLPGQHQIASEVVKHTRRGILRSALMRTKPLQDWLIDGTLFGEDGLDLDYDSIMVRTIRLRHTLSRFMHIQETTFVHREQAVQILQKLEQEARDIDSALQTWIQDFPPDWTFQQHCLEPTDSKSFYSSKIYSYQSPGAAAIWNRYYAMRMLINSTRLRILRAWYPEADVLTDEQCLQCRINIRAAGDDLAASLPFILQRFQVIKNSEDPKGLGLVKNNVNHYPEPYLASMAIWPLTIASSLPDTDLEQKLWFRSEIARVGRLVGARVFEAAETNYWLEM